MRALKIALLGVALVVGAVVILLMSNPLRRSENAIRDNLLQEMPLGSSVDVVRSTIERHGWRIAEFRKDVGFLDQRDRANRIVGVQHVRGELGSYQGLPFRANVTVFWGFDQQGKLIDVWVWKTWDGV